MSACWLVSDKTMNQACRGRLASRKSARRDGTVMGSYGAMLMPDSPLGMGRLTGKYSSSNPPPSGRK
jgi:aryl-alcohol dehydrogenase-like predicted oxidoreductase